MVSRNILSKCETGEDIVAITAAIAMDIEQYMDNELRKLKGTDLRNYTKQEIRTIVKDKL
jgi:Cdc6-like AAA superfamily ATPase